MKKLTFTHLIPQLTRDNHEMDFIPFSDDAIVISKVVSGHAQLETIAHGWDYAVDLCTASGCRIKMRYHGMPYTTSYACFNRDGTDDATKAALLEFAANGVSLEDVQLPQDADKFLVMDSFALRQAEGPLLITIYKMGALLFDEPPFDESYVHKTLFWGLCNKP